MDIHEGLRKQLAEFGYELPDDGWDAFLRGFASIGDLYGILAPRPKPYKPMTDEEINAAVAEDFRQDWEAVGRDMQSALDDYGREIRQAVGNQEMADLQQEMADLQQKMADRKVELDDYGRKIWQAVSNQEMADRKVELDDSMRKINDNMRKILQSALDDYGREIAQSR